MRTALLVLACFCHGCLPSPRPPRTWIAASPTTDAGGDARRADAAALEAAGYVRVGWVLTRSTEGPRDAEARVGAAARARGAEAFSVAWSMAKEVMLSSESGSPGVTGVNARWNTGGGGNPFMSLGGGGPSVHYTNYGLALGVLWRRGAPVSPPWLLAWRARVIERRGRCAENDLEACNWLERVGSPATPHPVVRESEWRAACAAGRGQPCALLADAYHHSWVPPTPAHGWEEIKRLYGRACELGVVRACAWMQERGLPGEGEAAGQALVRNCARGSVSACLRGDLGARGAVEDARVRACTGGDVAACGELGHALLRAGARKQDPERARALLATACARGEPESCIDAVFAEGYAHAQTLEEVLPALGPACEAEHAAACETLLGDAVYE